MNISELKNTGFFKTLEIKASEILFDEWDIDDNLYIVISWELSILKYINDEKIEEKELAIVWKNAIIWEGSLSNSHPKEVKIRAIKDAKLLKIDAKKDFEEFLKSFPKQAIDLLWNIIDTTNKRLLESNYIVTIAYNLTKYIWELKEFNYINLFDILDELESTLNIKKVIYFEKSPAYDDIFILRYDSKQKWKLQTKIFTIKNQLDLLNIEISKKWKVLVEELKIGNKLIAYLVLWDDKEIKDWQKKAIKIIKPAIASFIRIMQEK